MDRTTRGGPRKGAGPPYKLPFEARLWIWTRFRELRREKIEAKTLGRAEAAYKGTEQDDLLETIHKVPAGLQRKSDGKSARQIISDTAAEMCYNI